MNIKDVKPISHYAQRYGVKCILYGIAGSGKTPTLCTAPAPFIFATENGFLSVRKLELPSYMAITVKEVDEFFSWFCESAEAKQFETLGVDSISNVAELVLNEYEKKYSNKLQRYGEMANTLMNWTRKLLALKNKNVVLLCKENTIKKTSFGIENGKTVEIDVFRHELSLPGQQLKSDIPYGFDQILFLDKIRIPNHTGMVRVVKTNGNEFFHARDRSNNLDEIEYPDTIDGFPNLTRIFQKCMS
jgi:AAA domain